MPLPSRLPDDFIEKASSKPLLIMNQYSIVKKIGSGNFGTAFLIDDHQADNETEKKKVLKQICVGPLDPGETVDAMQEAKLLAKLKHENIVQFHRSFLDGQFFCIVLEYCEGGDLECIIRDHKKKKETISEDQVIKWLSQLLKAISYMHERRVLHRDLKSRNIFLKDNEVKIGDFGISKILIGTSDKASTFVGTPYYMSPQVLKHEEYDEKCDVWSLGCVLYEMCCLEHAFEGNSLMEVMVKIVSDYVPCLPSIYSRALHNILERMLDREAHRRQTAQQILQHPLLAQSDALTRNATEHLTARDRLRIKKQREADVKVLKLKEAAKRKWAENARIRRESVERNFVRSSFDLNAQQSQEPANDREIDRLPTIPDDELHGTVVFKPHDTTLVNSQQVSMYPEGEDVAEVTMQGSPLNGRLGSTDELIHSLIQEGHIPEDENLADTFYSMHDDFESSSDDGLSDEHIPMSDSEYRDMFEYMEGALILDDSVVSPPSRQVKEVENQLDRDSSPTAKNKIAGSSVSGTSNFVTKNPALKNQTVGRVSSRKIYQAEYRPKTAAHPSERPLSVFNSNMVDQRIVNMRQRCIDNLGSGLFEKAYKIVREMRFDEPSLNKATVQMLTNLVPDRNKCMELEQLIFLEQEKNVHHK